LSPKHIIDEIRACILPNIKCKAVAKADCFTIRPKEDLIDKKYLHFNLVSQDSFDQLTENIHGVSRPRINTKQLRQLNIRWCELPEQQEIVRRIEKLFALADSLEIKYIKAMGRVEKIEQSILAKAFHGELVEQDPNDEPAEELLKRILEEKEKLETQGKKRKKSNGKNFI
jgi:type I restriction enzyme, S subunit